MIQHVIRHVDENIAWLADAYGVSAQSIAEANGFRLSMASIYGWLSTHGGQRQAADPDVPTGYHWSFAPGMVVDIIHPGPSLSPSVGAPGETPVGPGEDIAGPAPPLVPVAKAAFLGGPMGWLIIGVVAYFLFGEEKPAPRKRRRKAAKRRKPAKRRRRR